LLHDEWAPVSAGCNRKSSTPEPSGDNAREGQKNAVSSYHGAQTERPGKVR